MLISQFFSHIVSFTQKFGFPLESRNKWKRPIDKCACELGTLQMVEQNQESLLCFLCYGRQFWEKIMELWKSLVQDARFCSFLIFWRIYLNTSKKNGNGGNVNAKDCHQSRISCKNLGFVAACGLIFFFFFFVFGFVG